MNRIWFTSDTHFGHKNILVHDKRPFATIEEMDEALIANWNSVVAPNDDVWHLGDFAYRSSKEPEQYLTRLNGRINIVWGNHDDKGAWRIRHLFASHQEMRYLKVNGQKLVLCHYALRVWRACHRGSWHLHGHSHGGLPPHGKSMDVGCMVHGYKPVAFEEIAAAMESREYIPHHGEIRL